MIKIERANVVPVHKKENKNLVKNHRPISLLPFLGKIFERLIYNALFNYFISNKLFTSFQSCFIAGYLQKHKQRVILNDQISESRQIMSGVLKE